MSTQKNSVTLHRVLKSPVDRVYRAFLDADAKVQWLPPYGFTAKVHEWNPKVGGSYRMSFTNFTTSGNHSWSGKFLELVPNSLIKFADTFDDPNLPGEMLVTVKFKEVMCGTELQIVQENIPSVIPLEMCCLGWQESLEKLAHLVEPEIKE